MWIPEEEKDKDEGGSARKWTKASGICYLYLLNDQSQDMYLYSVHTYMYIHMFMLRRIEDVNPRFHCSYFSVRIGGHAAY